MLVTCDCGNDTFQINFVPPLRGIVICTECDDQREIGQEAIIREKEQLEASE